MGLGRAGAGAVVFLGMVLLCLATRSEATVYTVGDGTDWKKTGWPVGVKFQAGDVIVFTYSPTLHNVVAADAAGYNSCTVTPQSQVHNTGKDHITLVKGANYFFCGFPGHCQAGMKVTVNAA